MNKEHNYNHWKLERDSDNILWCYFDKKDEKVNTINEEVLDELDAILIDIIGDTPAKGLVIGTAKKSGFAPGADIRRFRELESIEGYKALILKGQQVFNKLERLTIPTIAMIKGFCLGGGLELALACDYRVALDDDKTRLGLPEVLLGLHPGWGGSVRLTALIGALNAMPLMLTGKTVDARKAKKLGIVDDVVPERHCHNAVRYYINKRPKKLRKQSWTNSSMMRPLLARIFMKKTAQKVKREHYPAPFAMIENWRQFGVDKNRGLEAEVISVQSLAMNDTSKNLVRAFFLQEQLKKLASGIPFKAKRVHIIGAGVMGGDIAAWCASKGLTVTLQDREPQYIAPAIKRAHKLYKKVLRRPRKIQEAMDRLLPDVEGHGLSKADVVIEAIYENLEAKQALLKDIEQRMKANAILATNTSSFPLDELNTVLQKPERLVGLHFFNPVAKMRLVEIVHGNVTDEQTIKNATAFIRQIDRLPLPVKSSPGFLINRILMPYIMESAKLLEEGIPAPVIDKAAKDFGMPMGPVELADTVGLDICLSVAENLMQHYGGEISPQLRDMVNKGNLGKKTGRGFYTYKNGKAIKKMPKTQKPDAEITDRLILCMLNECMACLREKIVEDGNLLDAGMIFGTGFAPFRGGPIHYICTEGKTKLQEKLTMLESRYGKRFTADESWGIEHHAEETV